MFQLRITTRFACARACADAGATHLIGIADPDVPLPTPPGLTAAHHLRLHFADVAHGHLNWAASPSKVAALLRFAKDLTDDDVLIIHCEAGRSRSPAAAIAVLAQTYGVAGLDRAVADVFALRPQAKPNPLVIALADDLLDLDGRLSAAVSARPVYLNLDDHPDRHHPDHHPG